MIVKEYYETRQDGIKLYKTYSSENTYIKQLPTNIIYDAAIDVEDAPFTYEETDNVIEVIDENKSAEY